MDILYPCRPGKFKAMWLRLRSDPELSLPALRFLLSVNSDLPGLGISPLLRHERHRRGQLRAAITGNIEVALSPALLAIIEVED